MAPVGLTRPVPDLSCGPCVRRRLCASRLCSIHGIKYLWLDHNTHFNGTIPSCIGQLTMLRHIDLAYNRCAQDVRMRGRNLWRHSARANV